MLFAASMSIIAACGLGEAIAAAVWLGDYHV
jgi:hypothetical protein